MRSQWEVRVEWSYHTQYIIIMYNMPTRTRGRTSAAASRTNDTDDIIYMIRSYMIIYVYYICEYLYRNTPCTRLLCLIHRGGSMRANRRRDRLGHQKLYAAASTAYSSVITTYTNNILLKCDGTNDISFERFLNAHMLYYYKNVLL